MKFQNYFKSDFLNNLKSSPVFSKTVSILCFCLFLISGLFMFFYPMVKSNFDLMPGFNIDSKLITYTLEHYVLFLKQVAVHSEFWNMPFFYPIPDTLAMSDMVLGVFPIYAVFRLLFKLGEFSSLQGTVIVLSVLNYSCFYYLLRKQFKFSSLSSALGSFLFAFSLMRYWRLEHINYFVQFYEILALIFFLKIDKVNSKKKNFFYSFLAAFFLFCQCISTFILAYYLCILGFVFVFFAIWFRKQREAVSEWFQHNFKYLAFMIFCFLVMILPIILKFSSVETSERPFETVEYFTPTLYAWFLNISKINQPLFIYSDFIDPIKTMEFVAGYGLISTIVSILGLFFIKNKPLKITFLLTIIVGIALSCSFFDIIPWQIVYSILPGAKAIRSIIRISFVVLILISWVFANYFEAIKNSKIKFKNLILILSIIVLGIEHIPVHSVEFAQWKDYGWSKSQYISRINELTKKVPSDCQVLVCEPITDKFDSSIVINNAYLHSRMDCMWTSNKLKIYTASGYSGIIYEEMEKVPHKKYCTIKIPYKIEELE